jgi:CRP/FNR family transcriptional regulator, nitrogen oxide reductase regulator
LQRPVCPRELVKVLAGLEWLGRRRCQVSRVSAHVAGATWDSERRAALLKRVGLFAGLELATIADLAARFRARQVPRAGFIFMEGELASALHVAPEGRVKIVRETAAGKQVILRLIQPAEVFGVSGGWGGAMYPASAQALDAAVVLQLPTRDLAALIEAHAELALALIRELGTRLREAESRILDLQTEGAEARLARAVLRLAGSAEHTEVASRGVEALALTRQDLADLTGTTLSTASRTLSAWHRQGIVLALREKVAVRDRPALEKIAGS